MDDHFKPPQVLLIQLRFGLENVSLFSIFAEKSTGWFIRQIFREIRQTCVQIRQTENN